MGQLLGDVLLKLHRFEGLDAALETFKGEEFRGQNEQQKFEQVGYTLMKLIEEAPCSFLLKAVIEYITAIRDHFILTDYSLLAFEMYLNQFSKVSFEAGQRIRGKIVGRYVPREAYQGMFPVGMGKQVEGTHFVAAHSSPDLDTTVASFWGYLDAFAARVTKDLHVWNVPGGPPKASVEIDLLFDAFFGSTLFKCLAKTRSALTLTSTDLLTQQGVVRKYLHDFALSLDHERQHSAVVLVDESGYFLGDWRSIDVEGVRQVVLLTNNYLNWVEGQLHVRLISLFAKPRLSRQEVSESIEAFLRSKIGESDPLKEYTVRQLQLMQDYLVRVLGVHAGLDSTFEQLAQDIVFADFKPCLSALKALETAAIFAADGSLLEDRPTIFAHLEKIVVSLEHVIGACRSYADQLGVALEVKKSVFGLKPQVVSHRTDLEEIRSKMGAYPYLTVTYTTEAERQIPVGVIYAADLQKKVLGTVSLRDFCNREEVKIPPYLEVISVIDHHKTTLQTTSAPRALIADYQSSNSLVAELSFALNDLYSHGGLDAQKVDAALASLTKTLPDLRIQRRLLARKIAMESTPTYFVAKEREYIEYLHYLYAILDDTDLLAKSSHRDIEIVASLLNRLKSLAEGREVEIVNFDAFSNDPAFMEKAVVLLLSNPDFHSLYSKVYTAKERGVEERLKQSDVFADTKVLGGISRIGQIKLFAKNYKTFLECVETLRDVWQSRAQKSYEDHPEIDLHMLMVSTLASADDLFKGGAVQYDHQDELWIWSPISGAGYEHLEFFLSSFCQAMKHLPLSVEIMGPSSRDLHHLFRDTCPTAKVSVHEKGHPAMVVIRYPATMINSRKGQIAPHLPTA